MNYFLSNLLRDKMLWALIPLGIVAALNLVDIMTSILGAGVFKLWVVKITAGATAAGAMAYGFFLRKKEKKDRQLNALLPGFIEERKTALAQRTAADPEFHTFCHQCRNFDLARLGCLLDLRGRKAWIRLNDDIRVRFCLYWNLEEGHPVLLLTRRMKEKKADAWLPVEAADHGEKTMAKEK